MVILAALGIISSFTVFGNNEKRNNINKRLVAFYRNNVSKKNCNYDWKNAQSQLLSIDQNNNDRFKDKNGTTFREASFSLTRSLTKTQDVNTVEDSKVPVVTNEFKSMANFLIEKANSGAAGNFTM